MKSISLAIFCLFAMAPFLLMAGIRADSLAKSLELRTYYDNAIDNAVSDAAWVMAKSVRAGAGYGNGEGLQVDEEAAVDAFFDVLSAGLGASGVPAAEARVRAHVPVFVIVGNGGAVLRVQSPYLDEKGILVTSTVRLPEKPYSWDPGDGRHFVRFTMGTDIQVYDRQDNTLGQGSWSIFSSVIPGLQTVEEYSSRKLDVVTRTVKSLLEDGLLLVADGTGNVPATPDDVLAVSGPNAGMISEETGAGSETRFELPRTAEAAFRRAITDVGILAFVRGLPVGGDKTYSTYAFGGGRVIRKTDVVGYGWEERFIYCRSDCLLYLERSAQPYFSTDTIRFFSGAEEAAFEGYQPCTVCRP